MISGREATKGSRRAQAPTLSTRWVTGPIRRFEDSFESVLQMFYLETGWESDAGAAVRRPVVVNLILDVAERDGRSVSNLLQKLRCAIIRHSLAARI